MHAPDAPARDCPDCNRPMRLIHDGRYSTVFVCVGCGGMMTIPPNLPQVPRAGRTPEH